MLLFGVCMKYLKDEEWAKDTVQQVFLKALAELSKYEVQNLGGWLYQIAKNNCLTELRKHRPYPLAGEHAANLASEEGEKEEALWSQERYLDRMKEELQGLKEEQRICIVYFYLEKKTYVEIAALTGYTIKQVKSYIQNGKRNIKIRLEQHP